MSRRPVINITTTPQGWPARTGARRYSNTDSARCSFSSKAPPRVCCKPYPPLGSIKGEGKELLGKGEKKGETTDSRGQQKNKTNTSHTSEINISSNTPLYSFSETWDRFPLSWLVTPTQTLRCKEIQYPPLPAIHKTFFCLNQDKPSCILFASPSGVRNTQHKFTRCLRALPSLNTDSWRTR
jgi:hypothetical protein